MFQIEFGYIECTGFYAFPFKRSSRENFLFCPENNAVASAKFGCSFCVWLNKSTGNFQLWSSHVVACESNNAIFIHSFSVSKKQKKRSTRLKAITPSNTFRICTLSNEDANGNGEKKTSRWAIFSGCFFLGRMRIM